MQFPKDGLKDVVKILFDVDIDKSCQNIDWGTRPLPYKAKLYARDDTRWVQKIFEKIKDKIILDDFTTSNELCQNNVFKPDIFNLKTFKTGNLPMKAKLLLEFLWHKREEWSKGCNRNPGLIISNKGLVGVVTRAYETWEVKGDKGTTYVIPGEGKQLLFKSTRYTQFNLHGITRPAKGSS